MRALLYGLGALRAVIRARDLQCHQLTVLSAVSGGAIGAAFAASRVNLSSATLAEYDEKVLKPAVWTVTHRSLMFGGRQVWVVALAALAALAGGMLVGVCGFGLDTIPRVAVAGAAICAVPPILSFRGLAIERSMRDVLFGHDQPITDVDSGTHLVLQTTDLTSGEATYLTSRGVSSYRWGEAPGAGPSLVRAARSAATFPVVFGPVRMRSPAFTGGHEKAPGHLWFVDGGIYDNMGSEWLLNEKRTDKGVYMIVVNASRNLVTQRFPFYLPVIGELATLKREMDVQYDATTAPRRRWMRDLFRFGARTGTLVAIDKRLTAWVRSFLDGPEPRRGRALAMKAVMDAAPGRAAFASWPDTNSAVKTNLGKVRLGSARDLVRAGYLGTAIQTHILDDWPAPEEMDPDALMNWLGDQPPTAS